MILITSGKGVLNKLLSYFYITPFPPSLFDLLSINSCLLYYTKNYNSKLSGLLMEETAREGASTTQHTIPSSPLLVFLPH
jgi:hypothetical protein